MPYKEIKKQVKKFGGELPLTARNNNDENVIIEEGREDGVHYYKLTTAQNNDWLRINHYYEDGTVTETFDK